MKSNDSSSKEAEDKDNTKEIKSQVEATKGKTLTEALEVLDKLGVEYKIVNDGNSYDFTDECKTWSNEMKDGWVVKSASSGWLSSKYTLKITTQEAIAAEQMKETLQAKLSADNAETAVMVRGEQEYPYGFKFKYFTGETSDTVIDENTWLIKRSCEITNAFKATTKMTVEAKVTGTNDNPQVTDFSVY